MSRRRLACALGLLLGCASGCTPRLENGVYGCDAGSCPQGWECLSNGLCYDPGFPGFDLYQRCLTDLECAVGSCVSALDPTSTFGQCSVACSAGSCPASDVGAAGICLPGTGCVGGCATSADCDPHQKCVPAPVMPAADACLEITDSNLLGLATCSTDADCGEGTQCLRVPLLDALGVCAWPCSASGECPGTAQCAQLPAAVIAQLPGITQACLTSCDGSGSACGVLGCGQLVPSGGTYCAPPGWIL